MIKLICEQCKEEFERYPSQVSRFCSMKCYREWLPPRRVVICEQCGGEFTCKSCETDRRFCCEECYGLYREKTYSGEDNPLYGRHYDEDHRKSISKALKKSIKHKETCETYRGGTDIVKHHYIYDFDDLDKYTIKVTRSEHRGIHNKLRAAGLEVPCINIFNEEDDIK